jgi:polar amino acid transport system substrate-binding protein
MRNHRGIARTTLAVMMVLPLGVALVSYGASASAATTKHKAKPKPKPKPALKPPSIVSAGKLQFCSDISSPPLEFLNANQTPVGSDIGLGNAIAAKLHLKPVWQQTAFSGIIPALQAGHCDAILSQLYIKPARQLVVNFVPYMWSSESVTVPTANPGNITGLDSSLCGQQVATVTGTTAQTELTTVSDACVAAGKSAVSVVLYSSDPLALQSMMSGLTNAYTSTSETAAYFMKAHPGTFKFAGPSFDQILTGIAVNRGNPKLLAAIRHAFAQMQLDGSYNKIMSSWGLQRDEL